MQDGTPQSVTHPRSASPTSTPGMMSGPNEELPQGQPLHGDVPMMDGPWSGEMEGGPPSPGCSNGQCSNNGGCNNGGCNNGGCNTGCCMPFCGLLCGDWYEEWFSDLNVFTGVQGFKGPVDQGVNGDFGFHEGLNWGSALWDAMGIGTQIGFEESHSDLSRTNATNQHRNQSFLTAGFFHRPACNVGWQGGVVYDYLNDSFVDDFTVSQVRGDLSYVFNCHEIGFWFSAGVFDKTLTTTRALAAVTTSSITYSPIDMYAFYYGHHFCNGAEGRIWGGFTGGTGALVGADVSVPMSDCFALESSFNYIIPRGVGGGDVPPESWNLSMNLVWHPGGRTHQSYASAYRPLFNVADNGSFMVNRRVQ